MATAAQIAELRRKVSEDDESSYTDLALNNLIDAASGDVDGVASDIWEEKASRYAEMVDITEAGSSRKNGQLYANALAMAKYFGERTATDTAEETGSAYTTTRAIVRG